MPNTEKHNIRYDGDGWAEAVQKTVEMREGGYDIDMTSLLRREIDQFRSETPAETIERLGLVNLGAPVPIYRQPGPRGVEA